MSSFDTLISDIKFVARQIAEQKLMAAEMAGVVCAGFHRDWPKFSDAQRETFIKQSEEDAVSRIYAHLHEVATQSKQSASS